MAGSCWNPQRVNIFQPFQISTDIIAEIFRAILLALLLKREIITQELIDLLMSWNHNSGFRDIVESWEWTKFEGGVSC